MKKGAEFSPGPKPASETSNPYGGVAAYHVGVGQPASSEVPSSDPCRDRKPNPNSGRYTPQEPAAAVRQLIKEALDAPTPEELVRFLEFTRRFRRLSVWNARMAYVQRPGAKIIASEYEWNREGRTVAADAVPIIILWPFGPIRFVYELEDTLPPIDRSEISDPFAAIGKLEEGTVERLRKTLKEQKSFRVILESRRLGHCFAGSASSHGTTFLGQLPLFPMSETEQLIGMFAAANSKTALDGMKKHVPVYRVRINDRLTEPERFVTAAHELGHIFCGHIGACHGVRVGEEESGWPNRSGLGRMEREIEAEAVAFLVAARAGIETRSADYLHGYAKRADMSQVNIDLVVRAAARIERLANIHYGRMKFRS